MRAFRIQVNERCYTVSIEQSREGRFQVTVDGLTFEAEATSNLNITSWLVRSRSDNIHAQAVNRPNDRVDVWLACTPFPTKVQPIGVGGYTISPEMQAKNAFAGRIRALMPGRVTSIFVKEEDQVKEGAPLLILEAMKMQNEITSPTSGKVKSIFVREGETVKKDSVMILIE